MMIANDVSRFDEKIQAEIMLEEWGFTFSPDDSVVDNDCIKAYKRSYKDEEGIKYNIVAKIKHDENHEGSIRIGFVAKLRQQDTNKLFELAFDNCDYTNMLNILDGFLADGFATHFTERGDDKDV